MKNKLLLVTAILLVVAFGAFAADVTGKWTYEAPGRGGGAATPRTITLKAEAGKLTGTVPGFAMPGETAAPVEISNAKIDGDKVTFDVKMTFGDNEMITKYEGVVAGDQMKLKIQRGAFGGGDAPAPTEVTAKREK